VLEQAQWDGVDRLDSLTDVIQSDKTDRNLIKLLLTKWMLSAVALGCADENSPLQSAAGVLVFVGSQGIGKGQFLKWLSSPFYQYFLEGTLINPADKDSLSKMVRNWIIELGELEGTLNKSNMAALKALITNSEDYFRPAYGRKDVRYRRRSVFSATINHEDFLDDKTGSRRFWTIHVKTININKNLNLLQIWAQIFSLYKQSYSWHLTPEEQELLEHENSQFQVIDTLEDGLLDLFDFEQDKRDWETKWTTQEVLNTLGIERPTQLESKRLTEILRQKKVVYQQTRRDGKNGRYWLMPPTFKKKNQYTEPVEFEGVVLPTMPY
jgi:putative DNA primase/helicase